MLKGFFMWFTLGGVDAVRNLKETSFMEGTGKWLIYSLQLLCVLSVIVSIIASWWYFRPMFTFRGKRPADHQQGEAAQWYRSYALATIVSLVICAALSPIVLQGWQIVIALHAAVIPTVLWAAQWWQGRRPVSAARLGYVLFALFEVGVMITILSGQSIFHRSGPLPPDLDPKRDAVVVPYL
jgi:hypothetical protein